MKPLLTTLLALSLHTIYAQNLNVLNAPVPPSPLRTQSPRWLICR